MARVRLGDVAREYKETIKDSSSLPIVGLEHLTPGEISLEHWDEGVENTFSKGFKKGHMLFGRRRAYLKKAALAPFDGVCSGDITVIEAIPEKMDPELLPFIIQNDLLFDYAVGNSAGSLSPRVKWESLQNYEFELPERTKQAEMVELLKAAHETRRSYKALIQATDDLVKSQFIEMTKGAVETKKLTQISRPRQWKTIATQFFTDSGFPVYGANGQIGYYSEYNHEKPTIMIACRGATCGSINVSSEKAYINGNAMCLDDVDEGIDLKYLEYALRTRDFSDVITGSAQPQITAISLEKVEISIPEYKEQIRFAQFAEQSDKSKLLVDQIRRNQYVYRS